MDLSTSDYKKIAQFYQIPKQNNKTYKDISEGVLATKLCKCIKKVRNSRKVVESAAIGICRKSEVVPAFVFYRKSFLQESEPRILIHFLWWSR